MLMDTKCSVISSILVQLTFDDGCVKKETIAVGDLIDVEYNKNGRRDHFTGTVVKVDTVGSDPRGWYIIVDGSGDYRANQVKFSPKNILDLNMIRKANTYTLVNSPIGKGYINSIRIIDGRLQYSEDGITWQTIKVDYRDVNIKGEEGTIPNRPGHNHGHHTNKHPEHYVEIEDPDAGNTGNSGEHYVEIEDDEIQDES